MRTIGSLCSRRSGSSANVYIGPCIDANLNRLLLRIAAKKFLKMFRALSGTIRSTCRVAASHSQLSRSLSLSHRLCLKEIHERQEGDTLYLEGVYIKSPREDFLLNTDNDKGACPLCALGVLVNHTDVPIVKQFVDDFGKLLPRHVTGLCRWQQRRMRFVVEMATRAGLINALLDPEEPIPEYQRGWRIFNSYYDENLIPPSRSEKALEHQRKYEEAYQIAKAEKDAHEEMLKRRSSYMQLKKKL